MSPVFPQASVTWPGVTSLKPEQAWVPKLDCGGTEAAGEEVLAKGPACTCSASSPLDGTTISTSRSAFLQLAKPAAPKERWTLWLEERCEATRCPGLLALGFPPPASFLRVAPLTYGNSLISAVLQGWGSAEWLEGKGEEVMGHNPLGVCCGTFRSHLNSGTRLFRASGLPGNRTVLEKILPPCGHFL